MIRRRLMIVIIGTVLIVMNSASCIKMAGRETKTISNVPSLSQKAQEDILTVLVSEGSPLINLKSSRPPGQILQVKWSGTRAYLPAKIGDVVLIPFDDSREGMRLTLSVISISETEVQVRADVTFYDPKKHWAGSEGAEWAEMVFEFDGNRWRYINTIRGTIK